MKKFKEYFSAHENEITKVSIVILMLSNAIALVTISVLLVRLYL